jgi:3'-phosphoadenosine 5'-phosphosulfate (PAPS) 3'-phosphatase
VARTSHSFHFELVGCADEALPVTVGFRMGTFGSVASALRAPLRFVDICVDLFSKGALMALGHHRNLRLLHVAAALAVAASAPSAHPAARRIRAMHIIPPRALVAAAAGSDGTEQPVTGLLELCKEACDELSVLVRLVYEGMRASDATLKADNSVFTIADGLVQHLLLTSLLREDDVLAAVVGEEDACVQIERQPYTVAELPVPERLWGPVDTARTRLAALGARVRADASLRGMTAFVDPIDGTREFSSGLGEMCSICIGLAEEGRPVGGLVYRPLTDPPTWAYGCAREGVARSVLLSAEPLLALVTTESDVSVPLPPADAMGKGGERTMLASRGSLSPFVRALCAELPARLVRSGGAGNKALLLLEGAGDCYIQDRGLFRWDTCASQAVLEAHGGLFVKLSALALRGTCESYTYARSDLQLDFEPGVAQLSAYNAAAGQVPGKREVRLAQRAEQTKPYANVCGAVALAPAVAADVQSIAAAIGRARATHEMDIS